MATQRESKDIDITKSGPMTFRALLEANSSSYDDISPEFLAFMENLNASTSPISLYDARAHGELLVSSSLSNTNTPWGKSMFDESTATEELFLDLSDIRAENLPWYALFGAGVAKGVSLAVTTFLSGTLGLLYGAASAAKNQSWARLWDNRVTEGLLQWNDMMEQELPNYYTTEELEGPFWNHIFTANFLGDKLIKNLGFTVGALYSGGALGMALKATRIPKLIGMITRSSKAPAITTSVTGSLLSAVNEGSIEALNNSREWELAEVAKLEAENYERVLYIELNFSGEEREKELAKLHEAYVETMTLIQEDKLNMGNMNLLMNMFILAPSNLMQFGRYYANGYRTARKELKLAGKLGELTPELSKLKGIWAVTKSATSEGLEEISQSAANRISGIYYSTDVNNFYKALTDPNASLDVLDWGKAIMQGINETVNDNSAWEEFFIGSLTGALGAPTFRSMKGADGKWRVPFEIQGGAIQEWKEYAQKMERALNIADYLNQRVLNTEEFKNYYLGLTRHFKYQGDMDLAAQEGDEFEFKNAEHALLVSDITMFYNAGKLEDLKAMINSAYDTSDENLDAIIRLTTTKLEDGKLSGPYSEFAAVQEDGTIASNFGDENSKLMMIDELTKNKKTITGAIEDYKTSMDKLDISTGLRLNDDLLTELAWMKTLLKNWEKRAKAMADEIREPLRTLNGILASGQSYYELVRTEEGLSSPGLTEEYLKVDRNVLTIQTIRSVLEKFLANEDPLHFIKHLASRPTVLEHLMEIVDMVNDSAIAEDDKISIKTKLNDIVRLGKASLTYVKKLTEYLKDPEKQKEDHAKADKEAVENLEKKKSNDLKSKLISSSSLKEFRETANSQEDSESRDKVLKELEDEGNEMAKNYRETNQYYDEVSKAIDTSDADLLAKLDAKRLLQDLFDNSKDLNDIGNLDSIYVNNGNAFDEDSDSVDLAAARYQNAQYELLRAMSKVNNDNLFKDRFSLAYRRPIEKLTTLTQDTQTNEELPALTTLNNQQTLQTPLTNPNISVGNITSEELQLENRATNDRVDEDLKEVTKTNQYYRPAIPEVHIEASREGDFSNFNEVAKTERGQYLYVRSQLNAEENVLVEEYIKAHPELPLDRKLIRDALAAKLIDGNKQLEGLLGSPIPNFDKIYEYLDKARAFTYLNEGNLHVNDDIAFMIDPEFEESVKDEPWHTSPVIFMVDKKSGKVVGSLDSGNSVTRYEGLKGLRERVIAEYNSRQNKDGKFTAIPTTKVSRIMVGKIPYSSEERSLQSIPGVIGGSAKPVFGIMLNGTIVTNSDEVTGDKIMNLEDMSNKEGRLYLLIPNGAGRYSPAAVRVKHFNRKEFDIIGDVNVANTPIGEDIKNAITKLALATSLEDVKEAVKELVLNIYLQNVSFEFKEGQGLVIRRDVTLKDSESVDFNKFTQRTYSPDHITLEIMVPYILNGALKTFEEIYNSIVEALMNHNLPLLVNARQINTPNYNARLINSGILTSNLQQATTKGTWFTTSYIDDNGNPLSPVNPVAALLKPKDNSNTVGGTETVIEGTKVLASADNKIYYVDLKTNTIRDEKGNNVKLTDLNSVLLDVAWAWNAYGDATSASNMIDNKVIIPGSDRVLDRSTQKYLSEEEALKVREAIANRGLKLLAAKEKALENLKKALVVIGLIYENQKKVDKTRTDSEYYYVLEEDGQYHQYSRVHSRIGSNSKSDQSSTNTDALVAGSSVDNVVRQYFTLKDVSLILRPDNMTEQAFSELLRSLSSIKARMEELGERFLADNIVVFQKYPDGTRVAGELDILSVDKDGNFRIYDIKTSKYSFHDLTDSKGNVVNYFTTPSRWLAMSAKDYYTMQLSAYKNLFESQYNAKVVKLAILPFVLTREKETVLGVRKEEGISLPYLPTVNVPLRTSTLTASTTDSTVLKVSTLRLPIFNQSLEGKTPINDVVPKNLISSRADESIGYFEIEGELHRGHLYKLTEVNGKPIYITKTSNRKFAFYYVVFPNGKTFLAKGNVMLEEASKNEHDTIKQIASMIEGNPERVELMSSEKTILYDPELPMPSSSDNTSDETANLPLEPSGASNMLSAELQANEQDGNDEIVLDRKTTEGKTPIIWNREKELKWLGKVLPQLSELDRVRIVEGLIKVGRLGATAWGLFDGSIITLSDIAAEGTTYHEAFHAVFHLLLNDGERLALLNQYRDKHPGLDDLDLEEELAEDFREFVMLGGKDTRSLGRKIIDFFKSLFIKTKYWKDFRPSAMYYFKAINEGKYSGKEMPITTIKEARNKQEEYTKEMKNILAKAPRDKDGNPLAHNGRPSNLTERQYAQVRTKAFKNWFGDWENDSANASKVVDENGEPLVVYHGSDSGIINDTIDLSKSDDSISFFATKHKEVSKSYMGNYNDVIQNIRERYNEEDKIKKLIQENIDRWKEGITGVDADFNPITHVEHKNIKSNVTVVEIYGTNPKTNKKEIGKKYIQTIEFDAHILAGYNTNIGGKELYQLTEEELQKLKTEDLDKHIILQEPYIYTTVIDDEAVDNILEKQKTQKNYPIFESIKNPLIIDSEYTYNWNKVPFENKTFTTRQISRIAKERGYDGVIFNNIIDYGSGTDRDATREYEVYKGDHLETIYFYDTSIYIIFNPNQVKSATDNTGAFDTNNPDIRYRLANGKVKSLELLRGPKVLKVLTFDTLSQSNLEALKEGGWTKEMFDRISQIEKEHALECAAFF